jgi:thiol:disulfide interchange protein
MRLSVRSILAIIVCFIFLFFYGSNKTFAQIVQDNSKWTVTAKKTASDRYEIKFHVDIPKGWHIYAMQPGGDGSLIPTTFTFDANKQLTLNGAVKETGKIISEKIEGTDGVVNMYKERADFVQQVTVKGTTKITGTYAYQICDDNMCLPPKNKPFTLEIKSDVNPEGATTAVAAPASAGSPDTPAVQSTSVAGTSDTANKKTVAAAPLQQKADTEKGKSGIEKQSLWMLILLSFGGGLAAVFTPCIFSMIPITISFFTKRSKTRKEGIRNALSYSLSIIIIFTLLGVLISAIFGATALNALSTNWIANLFFFVIFVIFGISFLGAFEISLPYSWTSATDARAGVSSFGGIFFMALTLVIVSFSCTGPIIGPLLVLAGKGGIVGPVVGMSSFAVGLALPFAVLSIFPQWINVLGQSGGWLNQVKVVLGFVELMLALKFLSNADLAMGWRLLDREIFIAIWIVLSILLGLYLLDKFKLAHDDASPKNIYGMEYVPILKLFLAIVVFSFAVYLLPGMWGAPLNGVSAFVPPMGTFDAFGTAPADQEKTCEFDPQKYVADFKIYEPPIVKNLGLCVFYDYDEALAAAKKFKKPIMMDFTGITCVNCRKMESQVWSNSKVAKLLKDDFIVVSLYCDMNKIVLPKEQQYFSKDLNTQVVTLGDKNADLQASKFGSNSQPFYFFVDENGDKLVEGGYPYNPDVQKFIIHLENVKSAYRKKHP